MLIKYLVLGGARCIVRCTDSDVPGEAHGPSDCVWLVPTS